MTSQKKIESNRRNGRKERRPRSAKSRSRLNARKHGLSLPIMANHELQAEALNLAHAIAGEGADNALLEQALIIAECELDLQRVQEARRVAIEREIAMRRAPLWWTNFPAIPPNSNSASAPMCAPCRP
jgi:hypothetical protein